MLTEQFVASIGAPSKPVSSAATKDAGIFVHEFQPLAAQRAVFKNSTTPPNCLAVNETHIFAAQAEKAVVHVYNREKGNLEAIVPFTERITCLTLACDDSVLVLGTKEGTIFLWEICTGRLVTTAQSHLQNVTAVVVDRASNILLSASADSTVHVWSILSLLSFANASVQPSTPIRTFTGHRAEVNALALGHSSSFCNFAVSASRDKTCLIWDYHTNNVLRTYLLPSSPLCVALDAADRVLYLGYDDGSVQQLDLYRPSGGEGGVEAIQIGQHATAPIQPSRSSHWKSSGNADGAVLSVSLSYDGCTLLSGYESGSIVGWDVATGRAQNKLPQNQLSGPVNNLSFLKVTGFRGSSSASFKIPAIVKPKVGAFDSADGLVPGNYSLNVEFASESRTAGRQSMFERALTSPSLPRKLLDEGLNELATWHKPAPAQAQSGGSDDTEGDFMAFDDEPAAPGKPTLEDENAGLKAQIESLRRLQKASFDKIDKINAERQALLQREQQRMSKRGTSRTNMNHVGRGHEDVDIDMSDSASSGD